MGAKVYACVYLYSMCLRTVGCVYVDVRVCAYLCGYARVGMCVSLSMHVYVRVCVYVRIDMCVYRMKACFTGH
jgi:hypothetical protein